MKIAVDFDHTLLNSHKLLLDVLNAIPINIEESLEIYEKVKKEGYSIEKHAEEITKRYPKLNKKEITSLLSKYYRLASKYLYPDAIEFLRKLKRDGHEVHIVSKGTLEHQSKAIVSSGVANYVNKVFVTEDKNFTNGYEIVVGDSIDDKILADANNAKMIRVRRGKYANTEFDAHYVVKDLKEAYEVLKCME